MSELSFLSLSAAGFSAPSTLASSVLASSPPSVVAAASASAAGSGSLTTVGAATVAIVKSLSLIVGITPSGSLIAEIRIVSPISFSAKSTTSSDGILSAGQLIQLFF